MRDDIVGGHIGSKDGLQGAVWPFREALLLGVLAARPLASTENLTLKSVDPDSIFE